MIVLYYLLPFRPLYLLHLSRISPSVALYEIKREKALENSDFNSPNKKLSRNKDTFPKKDKIRFYFKTTFFITVVASTKFTFAYHDQEKRFVLPEYHAPLLLSLTNKSPPSA
jgi:hypothetical protein